MWFSLVQWFSVPYFPYSNRSIEEMTEFTFHTIEERMQGRQKVENCLTQMDIPLKSIRQTLDLILSLIQLDYIAERENKLITVLLNKKENRALIVLKISYSPGLETFFSKYRHMISWDRKEIKQFCIEMLNHDTGGFSFTRNNPYEAIALAVKFLHKLKVSKYIISSDVSVTTVEIEYPIDEEIKTGNNTMQRK